MKRLTFSLSVWICVMTACLAFPAFGQLPALIGDIDGFGMNNGAGSLLNSLINVSPYVTSANMDVPGATCGASTYKPFSRDGSTYILQMGDFLPDVNLECFSNEQQLIPLPMTTAPSTIRGVNWEVNTPPPANYANYTRGSNPWVTTTGPNTDCWDNREAAEITNAGAKFTDITISPTFVGAWPHLAADYPLAQDYDPLSFTFIIGVPAPTDALYLYFPIGDYDAGAGATLTVTSAVGNDLTPKTMNLVKQDNTYQQGLVQGIIVELYNADGAVGDCTTPFYDDWADFAVPFFGIYAMRFDIVLDMDTDPYYAIDYVVIDDDLTDYGILMVGPNRTYTTIQSAIDAAADGDTILVDPGTYYENIDYNGKNLTLTGRAECSKPIIDGGGTAPAVTLDGTEGQGTSIRGFVITNGYGTYGGGVAANGANIQIEKCDFVSNSAGTGGALYNTTGYVVDCYFEANIALGGGAVYLNGCSPKFSRCTFGWHDNTSQGNGALLSGGAVVCQSTAGTVTAPSFSRCYFYNNSTSMQGGAVYTIGYSATDKASAEFVNCEFWQNKATGNSSYGGALNAREFSSLKVVNCTFAMNSTVRAASGGAIYVNGNSSGGASVSVHNSLFWGDTSNGVASEIVLGPYGTRTLRYSIVQGEATDSTNRVYGSSGYNPNYISTAAATLNLRPQYILAGLIGKDPNVAAPPVDIVGNPRPMPNGTIYDWGAYEVFSY